MQRTKGKGSLMRVAWRGREKVNRGMDRSVYATGFRSDDVAATLIGRERKKRREARVDERTRPMNEPPWSFRIDYIRLFSISSNYNL